MSECTQDFRVGDLARSEVQFYDYQGAVADPDAVEFKVRGPYGPTLTYTYGVDAEVIRLGTGKYRCDWPITKAGKHYPHWQGTGNVTKATEDVIEVAPTAY